MDQSTLMLASAPFLNVTLWETKNFAVFKTGIVYSSCALKCSSLMWMESSGSYRACEAADVQSFSPLWVALTTPGTLTKNNSKIKKNKGK